MASTLRRWTASHPVLAFLIMVYTVTVPTSLSSALRRRDLLPYSQAPYDLLAHVVGTAVPAFIVTAAVGGRNAVRDLARRCLHWRVGIGWYLLAALGATILTVLLATALAGSAPLAAVTENRSIFFTAILPSFAFAFVLSSFAEEIGWTGFLFDRLQDRYRAMRAALIVSVPFALGHIPGFIVEGGSVTEGLIILGVLFVPQAASRVIVAWLYNKTSRSLVIVGLLHAAFNVTTQAEFREAFLPVAEEVLFVILLAIPIIPAILIAIFTKGRLSYQPEKATLANPAFPEG